MRARLFARFGPESGVEVEFGAEATIGRGEANDVPLRSREVSQRHARIFFEPESAAYWVEDLGSLNGTRLDGEPLGGRERLGGLHVLTFGSAAELFFLELDRTPGERAQPREEEAGAGRRTRVDDEAPTLPPGLERPDAGRRTRVESEMPTLPVGLRAGEEAARPGSATRVEEAPVELPVGLAGGAPPAGGAAAAGLVLEVLGSGGGRFELVEGDNLIGRSGRARIVLRSRELSRRHATLRVAGGRVWLRDEGSRNRTFLGGEEISAEVEIVPGAELRFGRVQARLVAGAAAAEGPGPG